MNPVDDLFRDALANRAPAVDPELWTAVRAARGDIAGVDGRFASALGSAEGAVPPGLWDRVNPASRPAPPAVDGRFAAALGSAEAAVPAGLWGRVWAGRVAARRRPRLLLAAVLLLFLALGGLAVFLTQVSGEVPAGPSAPVNSGPVAAALPSATAPRPGPATAETPGIRTRRAVAPTAKRRRVARAVTPPVFAEETPTASPPPPAAEPPARRVTPAAVATLPAVPRATAVTPLRPEPNPALPTVASTRDLAKPFFVNAPRLRVELLFGAAYANQTLTATTNDALPLREARSLSEYPELSHQVTFRGVYRLNERWRLRAGLTYAEIRNQFEYGLVINGIPTDARSVNRLRLLEVPLLASYRVPGRRLQVELNAGPVINLVTSARGRFLDPAFSAPRSLNEFGNYRRNTGVGFMGSLTTTYVVGKQDPFLLVLEPFFKAYPTAFTQPGASLRESYWVAGLQLGVRKGF